jgi:hypothetical protein
MAGDYRMRERGQLRAWGAWSPRCTGGPVWRAKPTIARHGRIIGGTWSKLPANGSGSLWDAGEGPVAGLGGLEPEIYKGEGAVNYCKLVHKFSIEPAHSRRTLFIPIYLNITPLYHLNIPIHHLHIKF